MNKDRKIPAAPTVYCPKDGEKVPIWYCLGSLTQGRERCPYVVKATVYGGESAEVECKWKFRETTQREVKDNDNASGHP